MQIFTLRPPMLTPKFDTDFFIHYIRRTPNTKHCDFRQIDNGTCISFVMTITKMHAQINLQVWSRLP